MRSKPQIISSKLARSIALTAGGLHRKGPYGSSKAGALTMIRDIGYVQIDTISVIMRAHHHILTSRVPGYRKEHLDTLQTVDKEIFEYWAHAAAYLPIRDFRFTYHTKDYFRSGKDRWPRPDPRVMERVLARVEAEGPLMARDFKSEKPGNSQGWWDWKPAKRALERLFFEGRLMVRKRKGFQKVYDLTERVVPDDISISEPTMEEYADYLISKGLRSYGLATVGEISYLRRGVKNTVQKRIQNLVEAGEIMPVSIRHNPDQRYYTLSHALDRSYRISKRITILSPFDHVTIQRDRLKEIFDFEYQIECYVPREKRSHGYFCLPVLYGDQFVGRADMKADRKTSELIVKKLILEPDCNIPFEKWKDALNLFARQHACEGVVVREVTDVRLQKYLRFEFHS